MPHPSRLAIRSNSFSRVKDIDENTGFRRYFWKAVRAASADQTKGKEHADAERA
ncbi:hypothetical protein [uncultured Roseibium sp.]|uniref:hypothetical protein n=1 Tax=uncultured Roseibium sp. TaxID=1936171 RepID=UPI003216F0F2